MSPVIENHRRRKQAHELFPPKTPVSDFIASGERSHGLVQAIIESLCGHWAPGGANLGVFDSKDDGSDKLPACRSPTDGKLEARHYVC